MLQTPEDIHLFTEGYPIQCEIIRRAKTAEEAKMIVQYLSTVDWERFLISQRQLDRQSTQKQKEQIEYLFQQCGGICDMCGNIQSRLYRWPYHHERYMALGWSEYMEICDKCIEKGMRKVRGYNNHLPVDHCDRCKRLVPIKSLFFLQADQLNYCLHCFYRELDFLFTDCLYCNKKMRRNETNTCYECKRDSKVRLLINDHLRRAIEAGTPATLTVKQWQITLERFQHKCAYCRAKPYQHLEHYIPIQLGGGTTAENCVPACKNCNSKKHVTHPDELKKFNWKRGRVFKREYLEDIEEYLQSGKSDFYMPRANTQALVVI